MDRGSILAQALELRELCGRYGVPLILNDDAELAQAAGADGVHVGQSDMGGGASPGPAGEDKLIGVSARTVEQALAAQAAGADYLGVGAMFPTGTKQDTRPVSYDTPEGHLRRRGYPCGGHRGHRSRQCGGAGGGAASPGWRWSQPCTPSPTWKRPPAPSGPRWSGWWAHEDRGGHLRSGRDPHRLHVHLERGAQGSGPEVWRKAAGGPGPGHPGDGAAGSLGVHGGYILPPLYARTGDGRGERPGDRGNTGTGSP